MTKNNDIDRYGYGIGFDRKGTFSFGNGFGINCIIFGVDMSSSVHVDNKKKDILILGEGLTQGLDGTTLTAEKMYSSNFNENNKKFCLRLHYKCFSRKDFSADNIKKTRLNGYVYDFSVDYDAVAVDDILAIHKYLMKKNNII